MRNCYKNAVYACRNLPAFDRYMLTAILLFMLCQSYGFTTH